MGKPQATIRPISAPTGVDPRLILASLPTPILVIDGENRILMVNQAAEQFLDAGAPSLVGHPLADVVPADHPLFGMIEGSRVTGAPVADHGLHLAGPRLSPRIVSLQVAPLGDTGERLVITIHETSIAAKIDRQMTHRQAARSVSAMAAMLAHEVKNPLSGIRGAAQLLEETATDADRPLTRLICDETDRICALVNRMDALSDPGPLERGAINIHEVLERVRRVAQNGFARNVRFIEDYDPSLPPVHGNFDTLVQVFLNLVKNAAEAVPSEGGEIVLTTHFQHGIRLAVYGVASRVHLPLVVTVQDNGPGIGEDLQAHLFDPFVTTKHNGTGLGLALVAKIVGDHGGVIEFDSQPRRTVFRVFLPLAPSDGAQ